MNTKRGLAPIAIVAIVLILIIGGYMLMRGGDEPTNSEANPDMDQPIATEDTPVTQTSNTKTLDIKTLMCADLITQSQLTSIFGTAPARIASDGTLLDGNPYPTGDKVQEGRSKDTLACRWRVGESLENIDARMIFDRQGFAVSSLRDTMEKDVELKTRVKIDGADGYYKIASMLADDGIYLLGNFHIHISKCPAKDTPVSPENVRDILIAIDQNLN